jgi:23S rRNA pseudouridine2605 synthase
MKREGKKRRDYQLKNSNRSSFRKKQNEKRKEDDGKMRLNKFIANAGICSRRESDKFIEAGVVTVNGKGVTEMGFRVSPTDEF